jgi:hypothetical protein
VGRRRGEKRRVVVRVVEVMMRIWKRRREGWRSRVEAGVLL